KGSYSDPKSRIWPFKRMHTKQQYDKVNDTLVYTHLWGTDNAVKWGNFNMGKAIEYGMKEFNKPYSGQFGFIETYSYWPITHMVAPKKDALACGECHAREGRLKDLSGFYLPGRDYNRWVDGFGLFIVFATFLGVLVHGSIRLISGKRRENS
ncbi:MAG: cytochrome C, partial [Nitrospiraceae bacterium]|nr:cytochrome C [Nitrospiraceae bacterium]